MLLLVLNNIVMVLSSVHKHVPVPHFHSLGLYLYFYQLVFIQGNVDSYKLKHVVYGSSSPGYSIGSKILVDCQPGFQPSFKPSYNNCTKEGWFDQFLYQPLIYCHRNMVTWLAPF